jgi:predicted Zn-dependent peptidase
MSCGVWVKQGSKHENENTSGLSHLVEHLMVNNASENNYYRNIIDEITSYGVVYNAGTTKETTSYYFTGLSNMLDKCISALATIIIDNRNFKLENLENEKKVVIQEATSFYSSFNQIKERTSQAIWGDVGVGKIIVGDIEKVKSSRIEQLQNIINSSYTPENSCIVVVGDIDYTKTLSMIEESFSRWSDHETAHYEEVVDSETGIYYNANKTSNAVISVGFRAPSNKDKDRFNIEVISKILGDSSLESRLVKEIRVKRGLAYNVGSFVSLYENRGTIGFSVVCSNNSVNEVIKIMVEEFNHVKQTGFRDEEIERAKKILETRTILDINDLTAHLKFLAKHAVSGQVFSLEHDIRQIKKIKKENVTKVMNEYMIEDNLAFAGIGNFDIDEVANLLKF